MTRVVLPRNAAVFEAWAPLSLKLDLDSDSSESCPRPSHRVPVACATGRRTRLSGGGQAPTASSPEIVTAESPSLRASEHANERLTAALREARTQRSLNVTGRRPEQRRD